MSIRPLFSAFGLLPRSRVRAITKIKTTVCHNVQIAALLATFGFGHIRKYAPLRRASLSGVAAKAARSEEDPPLSPLLGQLPRRVSLQPHQRRIGASARFLQKIEAAEMPAGA